MIETEPKVYLIAKSVPHWDNINEWLREIGVSEEVATHMTYRQKLAKTDGEAIIELAGRRCYKSFEPGLNPNVTKVRSDIAEYIDNILKSGHGSVLEAVSFSFAIENVSRIFTGEMNRHRAGMAISEGSMRYIRFDEIPFWTPLSIQGDGEKQSQSRTVINKVISYIEQGYQELLNIWQDELAPDSKFKDKKNVTSMMRRIIPMGVSTGGVWTGNVRAWRHIFSMRCSPHAEEEINFVCQKIFDIMVKQEPNLFGDFSRDKDGFLKPKYEKV